MAHIGARIPPTLVERFALLAASRGYNFSQELRHAMGAWVEAHEDDEPEAGDARARPTPPTQEAERAGVP